MGRSETITFSEGNTFVRIIETVRDKDIYLVQPIGLRPNDEFVEILFWLDAFKRAGAQSVTAIIPYFGYRKAIKRTSPAWPYALVCVPMPLNKPAPTGC